jgi:hypothetical protein
VAITTADEVKAAAAGVVAAFSQHDRASYFGAFAPGATFIFHNSGSVLRSRAEYEELWRTWESEGFRVLGCTSLNPEVQVLDDNLAIFFHSVRTTLASGDGSMETGERETIVFQRINGVWLGVHEHLSVDPTY